MNSASCSRILETILFAAILVSASSKTFGIDPATAVIISKGVGIAAGALSEKGREQPPKSDPKGGGTTGAGTASPNMLWEAGFSPNGQSERLIVAAINEAQKSILCATGTITSQNIGKALTEALKKGVKVMIVSDATSNMLKNSLLPGLAKNGIPVRLNNKYPLFRHKYMVVDNNTLQLGTYSYSDKAGKREAADTLVLHNAGSLAATYAREWKTLWDESVPLKP